MFPQQYVAAILICYAKSQVESTITIFRATNNIFFKKLLLFHKFILFALISTLINEYVFACL